MNFSYSSRPHLVLIQFTVQGSEKWLSWNLPIKCGWDLGISRLSSKWYNCRHGCSRIQRSAFEQNMSQWMSMVFHCKVRWILPGWTPSWDWYCDSSCWTLIDMFCVGMCYVPPIWSLWRGVNDSQKISECDQKRNMIANAKVSITPMEL